LDGDSFADQHSISPVVTLLCHTVGRKLFYRPTFSYTC
jgi:hypothetical protein